MTEIRQLKAAIDSNDLDRVRELMTANPELHRAPLGYMKTGPLTMVAECRVPWGTLSTARLAVAAWMIENGSDVHQGNDAPLMLAALYAYRIPMMELLVAHGADVNAGAVFAPCENMDPEPLAWLLQHGANPNSVSEKERETPLDFLIGTHLRGRGQAACIDLLVTAGGKTKYGGRGVLEVLAGRVDLLGELLDRDSELVHERFPRMKGGTLLHVAAEFGQVEAARLLLDRGADVNASATPDGQTPIFHGVSQLEDFGLAVTKLLLDRGADLSRRAQELTPLGYALRLPGYQSRNTVNLLRERGAES